MAAGGIKAGGYSRRSSRRQSRHGAMSDINVTPLVDVMLVLLIVFMVAAPLMTTGIPIELPKTKAKQLNIPTDPMVIAVKSDGSIYLQDARVKQDELTAKLQALAKNGTDDQVTVKAEGATPYGAVAQVMGILNAAGYNKIGLQTSPQDQPSGN
ncbi:ExbD/TolR family protein [Aestuariivirga litoralis]|uniref:ExbD/TolR family protein n=1 Tax=Aestuariivirga litoralis TaxID=2650924 RepID=UPI0018C8405A|nr:biopolymer transporter ExbD [Aestuariivirga litoralis]MBG1230859.1 biopolymer transporter ExbD [Aestuariivirga litoralis]